jgi:hypothetical protein
VQPPLFAYPGGIDFSTLQLRYLGLPAGQQRSKWAFTASPAAQLVNADAGFDAVTQSMDAFAVWTSMPTDTFWVNLNPDEPDRVVDPKIGTTDAGRIMLQADLRMKKTVGQLIHPDTELGRKFWNGLRGGNRTCLSFRQWIVPGPATVSDNGDGIVVLDAPLKVELESEYLRAHGESGVSCGIKGDVYQKDNELVFRTLILPKVEEAVNTAPEYAELRRIYLSRVLSEWYRQHSTVGVDTGDVTAWPARQDWSPRQVFDQYVQSYKKGEFNVTHKETGDYYTTTETYFYGGVDFGKVPFTPAPAARVVAQRGDLSAIIDGAQRQATVDKQHKVWLAASMPLGPPAATNGSWWEKWWLFVIVGVLATVVLGLIRRGRGRRRRHVKPVVVMPPRDPVAQELERLYRQLLSDRGDDDKR